MQRRQFVIAGLGSATPVWALAHHGWSSFDTARPLYLEGRAGKVSWRNPHAEFQLEVVGALNLPEGLEQIALPEQTAQVNRAELLSKLQVPTRKDTVWTIELAPLSRLQQWKVPEIQPGASVAVIGYTLAGDKAPALLRAEYLFVYGGTFGLRSAPV